VRQEPKIESKLKKIHKQQLKFFGLLMRMNDSRYIKKRWQGKEKEDVQVKHGKIKKQTF